MIDLLKRFLKRKGVLRIYRLLNKKILWIRVYIISINNSMKQMKKWRSVLVRVFTLLKYLQYNTKLLVTKYIVHTVLVFTPYVIMA